MRVWRAQGGQGAHRAWLVAHGGGQGRAQPAALARVPRLARARVDGARTRRADRRHEHRVSDTADACADARPHDAGCGAARRGCRPDEGGHGAAHDAPPRDAARRLARQLRRGGHAPHAAAQGGDQRQRRRRREAHRAPLGMRQKPAAVRRAPHLRRRRCQPRRLGQADAAPLGMHAQRRGERSRARQGWRLDRARRPRLAHAAALRGRPRERGLPPPAPRTATRKGGRGRLGRLQCTALRGTARRAVVRAAAAREGRRSPPRRLEWAAARRGRREQRGAGAAAAGAQRRDEEAADGLVQLARAARRAAGPRHQVLRRVRSRRRRAGGAPLRQGAVGVVRRCDRRLLQASGRVQALADTRRNQDVHRLRRDGEGRRQGPHDAHLRRGLPAGRVCAFQGWPPVSKCHASKRCLGKIVEPARSPMFSPQVRACCLPLDSC
mmetsp:Transcript_19345/g.41784  ORF Transcript_19345/g.41784 Transcript_19345/m.41784 type:complete len:438 (-) Transcript_19345:206-1519(-)